ncbi:uncharacterized protein LOC124848352 [Vigna umbellata]|uniref:uncharacterized protein LOC124848352 n=1 Tax=Vigna umbellata TaxID=87088 RepID=UPI001F5FB11E|nr:uncharacterized protein LOC124848352 [Vigna umbellata]
MEFLQLVQGGMFVSEYTDKFKHLGRFYTMSIDEEWQCMKFENGLRGVLKLLIFSLFIKSFPSLVERAKVLEKNALEVEWQQKQQDVRGSTSSRSSLGSRRTSYTRPSPSTSSGGSSSQSSGSVGQYGQQGSMACFNFGGLHYKYACPQLVGVKYCTWCRRNGHLESECNMGRRAVLRPPNAGRSQQRGGGRAQVVGRVYDITGAEAASSSCLLY